MYVLILISIVLLTGIVALIGAYLLTRDFRLKIEQRVNMVARIRDLKASDETAGDFITKILRRADEYVKRVFALGIGSSWGIRSGSGKLMLFAAASGAAAWFVARSMFEMNYLIAAALCIVAGFFLPHRMLLKEQRAAERKFNELFPDAVDTVARMLRAGLPATAAMHTVGDEAAEPIGQVFRTISEQMRIGISFGDALAASSQKINLPDFRFFTVSVNLQYATGGNLVFTLETLAAIIRKRRAVRAKAKALTSEIRMSAYVLGSLPLITLGALLLIQPEYLAPLIYDPRGHIILAMASGGLLLSMITMKKMMGSVTNG